jgi:hypothetical protein
LAGADATEDSVPSWQAVPWLHSPGRNAVSAVMTVTSILRVR